jgi:hypothetical protein
MVPPKKLFWRAPCPYIKLHAARIFCRKFGLFFFIAIAIPRITFFCPPTAIEVIKQLEKNFSDGW